MRISILKFNIYKAGTFILFKAVIYLSEPQSLMKKSNQPLKCSENSATSQIQLKHPIYKPLKKIGQGSFGKAYLVQSEHDHKRYILKKIRLDSQSKQTKQSIFQEVKLMQNLSHLYIIKYVQSFIEDKCVCLVMDYAQNGDLEKYLEKNKQQGKSLTQDQIITWFIQLCLGLKYIHERKVLHRDLKADNIFITSDGQLKIGDFGVSKIMNETYDLAKTKIGTPHIMAPEIFENMKYNQKSDIWSLGCVLYKLQMLKYPFQSTSTLLIILRYPSNDGQNPIQTQYSDDLKKLTYSLLSFEPKERPTVHAILEVPFIKKRLSQVLQSSINKYSKTQSSLIASKKLGQSNQASSLRKMSNRKSIGSLSNSILTPLSKKNPQNMTSVLQPYQSTNIPLSNMENHQKSQNLKMIQFKQNYPILLQESKQIKQENQKLILQKQVFEKQTDLLLEKMSSNVENLPKDQIIEQFRAHVLNFIYK